MYPKIKGIVEWVIALLLSPAALLISLLVGIIVYFTEQENPIFTQVRVGLGGKEFRIYKIRTMWQSWNKRPRTQHIRNGAKLSENDERFLTLEICNRTIPIGYIIRKWSLDELPQIFNVLTGKMSLIGPRPAQPHELKEWANNTASAKSIDVRKKVRPGITGLSQVSGRSKLTPMEKLVFDETYVKNMSFDQDFKILIKTIRVVLSGKNAY